MRQTHTISISAATAEGLRHFVISRMHAVLGAVLAGALCSPLFAQILPRVTVAVTDTQKPTDVAVALQIIFLITILAIAPSLLVMLTSFVRIIIAFSFLRRALGTQTMPPDQILVGLALFMTIFIMMPVFSEINTTALQPYLAEEVTFQDGIQRAIRPLRNFMLRQVDEKDVALFVRVSRNPPPRTVDDLPLEVIVPAFITSELKTAFVIGFILYIPFLIIDMVIASVLLSMGMMMLPPIMISLPFKIVLFVLIDGWHIVVRELITSFR